jgi:L-fucose mutarotase
MLKGIPKIISSELLKIMAEMGHGDELVIADGNFPCHSVGKNSIVIRADGHGVPEILDAILKLIPLDVYVEKPVALMAVAKGDTCGTPEIWKEYVEILEKNEPDHHEIEYVERFAFYDRAAKSYLIIATGEKAIYANILLKKGVVK